MKRQKTKTLLLATGIIIVLVAVMIVTVVKLRQLATVPVTPNAPSSKPQAAGLNENCSVDADCDAGMYCYQPPMPECPTGQSCVQVLPDKICQTKTSVSGAACVTSFTLKTSSCGATCSIDSECSSGLSCQSVDGAKKCVNPSCPSEDDCICPSASPTPEPDKCNAVCNPNSADTGCADGYTCEPNSRRCRKPACVDREDCTCKEDTCNKECNPNVQAQDSGCTDGLVCEPSSRRCRKAACTGEESCTCSTATPTLTPTSTTKITTSATPVPTTIPKAGNPLPGLLFVSTGGVLVILGVLAASLL